MANRTNLTCNCCGGETGQYQQWWNRDIGFGVCKGCVNMGSKDDMTRSCGKAGIHRPHRNDENTKPTN